MYDTPAVMEALEAATTLGDPTGAIYRHLFLWRPELEALFVRDQNGAVRGEMLARTIEMIFDLSDRVSYAPHMVRCEVVTHAGYGVPPEDFPLFFHAIAAGLKETAGEAWTDRFDQAWSRLLLELEQLLKV